LGSHKMDGLPMVKRCAWALSSQQSLEHHDKEWGVPVPAR